MDNDASSVRGISGGGLIGSGSGGAARLTKAIGWVSITLGLVDWVMAETFADGVGMDRGKPIFRTAAARELATGVAAVRAPTSVAPIAARLMGDIADLGVLGFTAARPGNPKRGMAALGVGIVAAVTAVDVYAFLLHRTARTD